MKSTKLASVLIAGLVVCLLHVVGSSAQNTDTGNEVLEGQTGEGVDAASAEAAPAAAAGGGDAEAQAAAAANPPENPAEGTAEMASPDDAQASGQSADNAASDDQKPPEESEESLAVYIANHLFSSSNNTSSSSTNAQQGEGVPANAAAAPAAAAAAGNSTKAQATDAAAATANAGGDGGAPSPNAGQGDGGEKQGDRWNGDGWSTSQESTASSPGATVAVDCNKEVDLRNFCDFTEDDLGFFNYDTTARGLQNTFMNRTIVDKLSGCPRGEWCIGNELGVLKAMQNKIYKYPELLCRNDMWDCIFFTMEQRENCMEDQEFLFLVDALDLLCSLSGVESLERTPQESTCMAYVQAAAHVSYADFLANNMMDPPMSEDSSCDGYAFRMTKTYLCADENCKGQFESRQSMGEFRRWSWFLVNVAERAENCPALRGDTCGPLQDKEAGSKNTEWMPMTPSTPLWASSSTGMPGGGEGGEGHREGMFGEEDESLMMALSVATAMVVLFMALGLLFFWRRRRGRNAYYYKSVSEGYDKVPGDEAHLLGRSSHD